MTKQELLAIVETLKEFKGMLWGQQIMVYTNHINQMQDALGPDIRSGVLLEITLRRVWPHHCVH